MGAHGVDDSSVTWTNRAGETATSAARIVWVDRDCRFVTEPSVEHRFSGGTTFATYWALGETVARWTDEEECERVQLRIRFGGVFTLLAKFKLSQTHVTYVIRADGSGVATRL